MRALLMIAALSALSIGCTASDACDGLGTCLAVVVMPGSGAPVSIDQLEVTVSGQVNGTRTLPSTPRPVSLPQTLALEFNPPGGYMGAFTLTVEVVGRKAGAAVANGQAQVTMTTGKHQVATVVIIPRSPPPAPLIHLTHAPAAMPLPP